MPGGITESTCEATLDAHVSSSAARVVSSRPIGGNRMDTQAMHPDPCSRAGLSCARYAGVARTRWRWKSQPGPSDSFDRAREIVVRAGSWSRKWQYCRSQGRLLGRHQWRVWRHGARGSELEQPVSVNGGFADRGSARGRLCVKRGSVRGVPCARRKVPCDTRGSARQERFRAVPCERRKNTNKL